MANIVPAKKSNLSTLTAALNRAKEQSAKVRDNATMVARELVSTAESAGAGFAAGFGNEKWGVADEYGIKEHKTSGVPTSLLAGAALKLGGALGAFGEFQRDAFAVGTGVITDYASRQGARAAKAFEVRNSKAATPAPAQLAPATPAPVATPEPAKVAVG